MHGDDVHVHGRLAADLPEEPAVNGDVWTVNPDNAQYVLDGAYGSIDGKTINFWRRDVFRRACAGASHKV